MLCQKLSGIEARTRSSPRLSRQSAFFTLIYSPSARNSSGQIETSGERTAGSGLGPKIQKAVSVFGPLVAAEIFVPPALSIELPQAVSRGSYFVTLGLFVMTVPGLWSLIKRAPKSKIRRRTYSVPGPSQPDAMPLDERAKQITRYFLSYNYAVKSMGDVISFVGNFQSSIGQASQLVLYSFFGLGSIALVLSTQFPEAGNYWYLITAISPLAGWYYWTRANREEEIKVKLVTSEDNTETEIVVEGDEEELDRFRKELKLQEKGKVYVKGILER